MSNDPYNTKYDFEGRDKIQNEIKNFLDNTEGVLKLAVIGSPDCKEIKELHPEYKQRIDLFYIDSNKKKKSTILKDFNSTKKIVANVFSNHEAIKNFQPDIVFHRWFLHHCTTEQKRTFCSHIKSILSDDGKMIFIDWFIPDYIEGDLNSKWESTEQYYEYQENFDIVPPIRKRQLNHKLCEKENKRGGKFISIEKMEEILRIDYDFERHLMCTGLVENPELFGQNMYICTKRETK